MKGWTIVNSNNEDKKSPKIKFVKEPKLNFSNIILELDVKKAIDECIAKIKYHDLIYNVWEIGKIDNKANSIVINFYGPPGTGKTMCAEALAYEFNKNLIEIIIPDLVSSTMGDTSKNIIDIFNIANQNNAIIFFDEADSMLDKRRPSSDQGTVQEMNRTKTTLLKELDNSNNIVIFATNTFQSYDNAFIRRILSHIEFKLPGIDNRKKIFDLMLSKKVPGRENLDFDDIALQSDGLSGADIKSAIIMALTSAAMTYQQILQPEHILDKIKEIKINKENHSGVTTTIVTGEEREKLLKKRNENT